MKLLSAWLWEGMAELTQHPWEKSIFGAKAGFSESKSEPKDGSAGISPLCPKCGSAKVWKDGYRNAYTERIQRWLCRKCNRRFSDPIQLKALRRAVAELKAESDLTKPIKSNFNKIVSRQICASIPAFGGAKNLEPEQTITQTVPGKMEDIKGQLVQFAWAMQQNGYAKTTIRLDGSCLRALIARGANLQDPMSVKSALAREQNWSQARRQNVINAYTLFLKFKGLHWEKPRCTVTRKFPFIPTEQEIDALIAGCPNQVATFLQLLKETAMRSGEAKRLMWTDIDFE